MILKVSVEIDIDTTDLDIEDIREDILDLVKIELNTNPESALIEPLC